MTSDDVWFLPSSKISKRDNSTRTLAREHPATLQNWYAGYLFVCWCYTLPLPLTRSGSCFLLRTDGKSIVCVLCNASSINIMRSDQSRTGPRLPMVCMMIMLTRRCRRNQRWQWWQRGMTTSDTRQGESSTFNNVLIPTIITIFTIMNMMDDDLCRILACQWPRNFSDSVSELY